MRLTSINETSAGTRGGQGGTALFILTSGFLGLSLGVYVNGGFVIY